MGFPEFAVVHILDAFPDFGIGAVLLPSGSEMTVVQTKHLRRQPGRNVYAVGDMPDGNFVLGLAGIEAGPHGARNLAVQRGDRVGAPRQFQAEHGHAEILIAVAGIFPTQFHQAVCGNTQGFAQRSQMFFHQFGVEAIMAGGHWSVSGKDHFAGNPGHGLIKADSLILHATANGLQHREAAVAFVQVQNARRDAHRLGGRGNLRRQAAIPGGPGCANLRHTAVRLVRDPRGGCPRCWSPAEADRSVPLSCARLWREWGRRGSPPVATTGSPLIPIAASMGNWLTSVWMYSSCCQPVRSRRWRK